MKLNQLISISPGFQRSVNVRLDISNSERVSSYIPTEKAESIIQCVSSALTNEAKDGAVMLIGSYGTGKSHLATFLASLASKSVNQMYFDYVIEKLDKPLQNPLSRLASNGQKPYLAVPLSGSDELKLDKQLLQALKRSLDKNDITINLSTSFTYAIDTIHRWESEYPETYQQLGYNLENSPFPIVEDLIKGLGDFNDHALNHFKKIYPKLTAGASFDILTGDILEVFESACQLLGNFGYKGIMIIFDEFNKVMEKSVKDSQSLKVMQDLAELATRNDNNCSLNLMLISHKTISQYVGNTDTNLADEWRKIEGRFRIFDVSNKPWEAYDLISRVLKKETENYYEHIIRHNPHIINVASNRRLAGIFEGVFSSCDSGRSLEIITKGCLPLHPVTVYILPRISAKLAQNERTLFTFLSGQDGSPIPEFLCRNVNEFEYVLPWHLYDYFEEQLTRSQDSEMKAVWSKVTTALKAIPEEVEDNSLLTAVIKTIGIIQLAGNSLILPCTTEIVSYSLVGNDINKALGKLEEAKLIVVKKSSDEIEIVEPTDFNFEHAINEWGQKRSRSESLYELLSSIRDHYLIPYRYNHQNKMTRYLYPVYLGVKEIDKVLPGGELSPVYDGLDGIICYLLPESTSELETLESWANRIRDPRALIVLPNKSQDASRIMRRALALIDITRNLIELRADARTIHLSELYKHDALQVLDEMLRSVITPSGNTTYYWCGQKFPIVNELDLSEHCSIMLETVYHQTPIFNNELINKSTPTVTSRRARNDVIDGIINSTKNLRKNLRSAQERFMLDTLFVESGLYDPETELTCSQWPEGYRILETIEKYFKSAQNKRSFDSLCKTLTAPPYGVRSGVIPALLAVCIVKLKEYISIKDSSDKDCQIDAALLDKVVDNPKSYCIKLEDWNLALEKLTIGLAEIFGWKQPRDVFFANGFNDLGYEVFKWFSGLPRYSRETQNLTLEAKTLRSFAKIAAHRPRQSLLTDLPNRLGFDKVSLKNVDDVLSLVKKAKHEIDTSLSHLRQEVKNILKHYLLSFGNRQESIRSLALNMIDAMTVSGASVEWGHLISFVNEFKGYNEDDFTSGMLHKLIGVRIEDWIDSSFEELSKALDNLEKAQSQAAASNSGSRVEVVFYKEANIEIKYTLPTCDVSDLGETLQNHIETAVNNFGDAISSIEKRQILLNILRKIAGDNYA